MANEEAIAALPVNILPPASRCHTLFIRRTVEATAVSSKTRGEVYQNNRVTLLALSITLRRLGLLRQTLLIRKYLPSAWLGAQTSQALRRGEEERAPHAVLPASLPREMLSAGAGGTGHTTQTLSAGRPRGRNSVFSGDTPPPPPPRSPPVAPRPGVAVRGVRRDEPRARRGERGVGERSGRSETRAFNTNATQNAWINYAEGFLDFFQVIKFRFLAFILVPGSTRRHGRQKSSLIVPGFKFDFVT